VPAVDYGVLADDRFFFTHRATPSYPIQQILMNLNDPEEKLYATVSHLIEALELLDYLHEAGTTHRDLSLAQIRIDRSDCVFLEGYINARPKVEARNLIKIVNMPYMSPEQLSSVQSADSKTDIYSCGCILFELLTGELPYESNFKKVEDARQGITPVPSQICEVASELDAICVRSMAQRSARYGHVREMITDLENFHRKRPIRHKVREFSALLRGLLPARRV
jgi:serine/threonine protein kinase